MKKRIKLFASIATICLSLAVMVFGVFSALAITYKTTGTISYEVEDAYVEIETRVYSTSKKYASNAELKESSQSFENSNFTAMDSLTSVGIVEGSNTYEFRKVQIKNLDKGSSYEVQATDYVDTYSSVANNEPPADLELDLKYTTTKEDVEGVYTYFVVTKLTNKSILPLYAYVPTTGDDKYVAPENSLTYKFDDYKELTNQNDEIYVVFSMCLDKVNEAIEGSDFVFPVSVTKDKPVTGGGENVIPTGPSMTMGGTSIDGVPTYESVPTNISTSLENPTTVGVGANINLEEESVDIHIDFSTNGISSLAATYSKPEASDNIIISFNFAIEIESFLGKGKYTAYNALCILNETIIPEEEYVGMLKESIFVYNDLFFSSSKSKITESQGLIFEIDVNEETGEEVETITIPTSLLHDGNFTIAVEGDLALLLAEVVLYQGDVYLDNCYTNKSGLGVDSKVKKSGLNYYEFGKSSITYSGVMDPEIGGYFVNFGFANLPEEFDTLKIKIDAKSDFFVILLEGKYVSAGQITDDIYQYLIEAIQSTDKTATVHILKENVERASEFTLIVAGLESGYPIIITPSMGSMEILTYEISDLGEYYEVVGLTNRGRMKDEIIVPETYNDLPVKVIGEEAFYNSIASNIVLPSNLVEIRTGAFNGCENLTSLVLPENLEYVAAGSLNGLQEITVLSDRLVFEENASGNWRTVTSINVKDVSSWAKCTVPYTPNNMYYDATLNLIDEQGNKTPVTEVILENGVETLCSYAFRFSTIEKVHISKTVKEIQEDSIVANSNIKSITVAADNPWFTSKNQNGQECNAIIRKEDNCLILSTKDTSKIPTTLKAIYPMSVVKESAIDYNGGKYVGPTQNPYLIIVDTTASTGDFVIHNDTKLVYDSAVMYNNFSSITIPNGVVYISEYGFAYSYKVTNIQIPNTVEYIGYSAFSGCELFTVTFESGSKLKRIESHAFYLNPLTSIVIPEGVEYIGESCFYYCEDLTEITIPSTLKYARRIFGSYGSDNSLGRVNISNLDAFMVNHIGLAFTACSYDLYLNGLLVTEIVIPEGVTRLDDGELTGCKSVTKVTLPNSIEYIGGALNTSMLSNYTVYNNLKYIGNSENEYLYLIGVSNTGQTTYTIHESTKIIRGSTFNSCNNLTSLTIPKSVTFIGSYLLPAFNEVDLRFEENSNLKYLDNYSLYYGIIQTVVISKNVQYIGNGAIEQAFTSDGKVSFETIIFEDGSNIEYGEIEPIRLKEAVRTIVFESLSFVNGTKIKKDLKCLFETLLSGSVVKVKCSSVSAVKLSILTNKYKFTASYDSATGYAIFTKI